MNEMLNNPFGLTETEIYVFGLGREHEQERIIKLLNELWEITYAKGSSYPGSNAVLDAIALIKGEK